MEYLKSPNDPSDLPGQVLQDTVGAVAWDTNGGLAAGVSRYLLCPFTSILPCSPRSRCSGGLLLKYPGRVGEVCFILFDVSRRMVDGNSRQLCLGQAAGLDSGLGTGSIEELLAVFQVPGIAFF